ncbi:beta-lactamase family protein [Streptomyces sp. NBC_01317]|uniref:serine hydrolase domain-containing protein n=1 Tax=Streptomyces sp. NBC_01317 TaxID=2903822 RepID=UPI002E0FF5FF|nr:beta-lactamase family protein [Streptomyces sp. NBC_01317]
MSARTAPTHRIGRRARLAWTGALAAAALASTALAGPAVAGPPVVGSGSGGAGSAVEAGGARHSATQRALDAAVADGVPGVLAQVNSRTGTWSGTAGLGDTATGRERGARDRFRVGSVTKTFVSTVLLQLEAEGRLDLDDTVDHWLPGVVGGNGHDGRRVILRQLLNHTSGIYSYTADPGFQQKVFTTDFLKNRYRTWQPGDLVAIAMTHAPDFAPGTDWNYSNTNYVLAGLVVEKVTGRSYATEIERRILRPLHLTGTRLPGTDPRLPRPSGRAYAVLADDPERTVHDVTELNATMAGAAGSMISDAADLNRFFSALLTGRLLPPAQLKEMKTTVALGSGEDGEDGEAAGYGLGLEKTRLSCGTVVWGHGGGIHGSSTGAFTTADGTHSLSLNFNADWAGDPGRVVEAEFCG